MIQYIKNIFHNLIQKFYLFSFWGKLLLFLQIFARKSLNILLFIIPLSFLGRALYLSYGLDIHFLDALHKVSSDYITAGIFAGSLLVNLVTSYLELNEIKDGFNLVYLMFNIFKQKFYESNYDYNHVDLFNYKSKSSDFKISNISLMQSGSKNESGSASASASGSASGSGFGSASKSGSASGFITSEELAKKTPKIGKMEFITSVSDTPIHIQHLFQFNNEYLVANTACIERLKKCNSIIDHVKSLQIPDHMKVEDENKNIQLQQEILHQFFVILNHHSSITSTSISNRSNWLYNLKYYVSDETKTKVTEISKAIDNMNDDYLDNVAKIGENATKMKVGYLNHFFSLTNNYTNSVRKELAKLDSILLKEIKLHPTFKNNHFNIMVMKEYPAATKAFNDQEGYLKKKISEILNAPRKK